VLFASSRRSRFVNCSPEIEPTHFVSRRSAGEHRGAMSAPLPIAAKRFHPARWERNPMTVRAICCWSLLALFLGATTDLRAAEPTIRNLAVRGLQIGGTTTLVVDGD